MLGEVLALERKDRGASPGPKVRARQAEGASGKSAGDVGSALRTVFEQTVSEDIPPEMLDLLNKLA